MEQQIEGHGHAAAAQRVARRTHVVMAARAPAGAGRAEVVAWLWKALCERCPSLEDYGPAGVGTVDLEDGRTVRWASDPAGGAIACEVIDIEAGDWWEAFIVHVGDGGIRTGWRRRGAHLEAPPVWEDAVVRLSLEGEVRARNEPHFLSLVASICAEGDVAVSSSDLQEREGLEVTLAHYKALSSRQAAAIRTLRSVPRVSMGGRRAGQHEAQEAAVDQPWTLPDLERWADENADRIVVLPRAIAEAKKSPYEDHQRKRPAKSS